MVQVQIKCTVILLFFKQTSLSLFEHLYSCLSSAIPASSILVFLILISAQLVFVLGRNIAADSSAFHCAHLSLFQNDQLCSRTEAKMESIKFKNLGYFQGDSHLSGYFMNQDRLCPPQETILWSVLRGVKPLEIKAVGELLAKSGFTKISVTVDTPDAYKSIRILKDAVGKTVLVGASTVITPEQVESAAVSGAAFISSPHTDERIIKATKDAGLLSCPGIVTPTEAFQALHHGADALKVFPSKCVPPEALKILIGVLPPDTVTFISGGVTPDLMNAYTEAGARGFAIGGSMYHPGIQLSQLEALAHKFLDEIKSRKSKSNAMNLSGFTEMPW